MERIYSDFQRWNVAHWCRICKCANIREVGLWGDLRDGLGEGSGEQSSVAPTGGKQSEHFISGLWGVCIGGTCLVPHSGPVKVLEGEGRSASVIFSATSQGPFSCD